MKYARNPAASAAADIRDCLRLTIMRMRQQKKWTVILKNSFKMTEKCLHCVKKYLYLVQYIEK